MDKKAQLSAMIDGIIKGDPEAAKAAFAPYIQMKTREVLGYTKDNNDSVNENVNIIALREWIDTLDDSPVRLQGDRVLVDGKQVGVLQTDPTDFNSGINFIEDGGKFSKEFDTIEDLFNFLIQKYTKRGDVA